jgi:DNA polymerase family A
VSTLLGLDWESYYDHLRTLTLQTTEHYVREIEDFGTPLKFGTDAAYWVDAKDLDYAFSHINWADTMVYSHHAHFDMAILAWKYKRVPKLYLDTLSMASVLFGPSQSVSLKNLASKFELGIKTVPYDLFKGRHWDELDPITQKQVADGACHDIELTFLIFNLMRKNFPEGEYQTIDATIRMFVQPQLRADVTLLDRIWQKEERRKIDDINLVQVSPKELKSRKKFQALLEAEGVEVEMKTTPKGNLIPAFAQTDQFMLDLVEHDDPLVSALARAKLNISSSQLQLNAEKLGFMAQRSGTGCELPVYLKHAGSLTHRDSGGDKYNWQNMKRGSPIRKAIMALPGFTLIVVDLSQIELRMGLWLADEELHLDVLRQGGDPYIQIASEFYQRPITKADKPERGLGKQATLSCLYGSGAKKFMQTAKLGTYGPPVVLSYTEAKNFVDLYRRTHPGIVSFWAQCETWISDLVDGRDSEFKCLQIRDHRIWLPDSTALIYDSLEWHESEDGKSGWRLKSRGWKHMYGARMTEHICSSLSRTVMMQAAARIRQKTGLRPALRVHDELVFSVPVDQADEMFKHIVEEMKRTPDWAPGLPLDAEGSITERYK